MPKLLLIFDYFKEAFHINKRNKALYKPQIALIAINVLLILLVGISVYRWINIENITSITTMESKQIFYFLLSQGLKLIAIILAYALISVFVESGILNMYKNAVTHGFTEPGDFKEGVHKYFFKLLLGKILIALCYIIALPFYVVLGIFTLTVGFAVIPLIAGVFLTMWKVSLVMNDSGIFSAIKDSFSFAKRNFIPLTVLQIIHWAFIGGTTGGGANSNYNFSGNGKDFVNWQDSSIAFREEIISIYKIVIGVLIPIAAITTISVSIIKMIFEVFFSLALFVAYKNDFRIEEPVEALPEEISESLEDDADNTEVLEEAIDDGENGGEVLL